MAPPPRPDTIEPMEEIANSSDLEVKPRSANPYADRGMAKILQMQAHSEEDRAASKRMFKNMEATFAAISTNQSIWQWVNTWDKWIIRQRKPFVPDDQQIMAEHLYRFLEEVLLRTTPRGRDKLVPSEPTILSGIICLTMYWVRKHPKWKFTNYLRGVVTN